MRKSKNPFRKYKKGDVRRLFILIAAIDSIERPTMCVLARYLGCSNASIGKSVEKINEQLGVNIVSENAVYRITKWGDMINKKSIKNILHS